MDLPNTEYVIPETQLYETLQVQRRRLVNWCGQSADSQSSDRRTPARARQELREVISKLISLTASEKPRTDATDADVVALCRSVALLDVQASSAQELPSFTDGIATQQELSDVMNSIQAITSDTGSFAGPDKDPSPETIENWGFVTGRNNTGRFTVTSLGNAFGEIQSAKPNAGIGAEIDFQLAALTVKNAHVVALDEEIANMPDVKAVFGNESMQATCIESAEHRSIYRLMGRGHDIHFWQTEDSRKFKEFPESLGAYEREYFEDLDKSTEMWAAQIFEPIRKAYFVPPPPAPPIRFLLRPEPAKEDATVITMVAVHPDKQGAWKVVVVSKTFATVQCFEIVSHGRRWYTSLQYCNDRRYALRCLMPDMAVVRRSAWPEWERHGGGHPHQVRSSSDVSAIITRGWGVQGRNSRNLSGGIETFVPDRLLFGLLPEALLDPKLQKDSKDRCKYVDRWEWWQGEDDTLRGYPVTSDQQHVMIAPLEKAELVDCVKLPCTCARVRRVSRLKVEQEYQTIIELCEQIISRSLLVESALGRRNAEGSATEQEATREQKKPLKTPSYIEDAPVSFELFGFVKSMVSEFGCARLRSLVEALATGATSVTERTFETRRLLRKAISTAATEHTAVTVESTSTGISLLDEDMELIDLMYTPKDGKRHSLAKVISRIDNIAHVLCWSRTGGEGDSIDVVEVPRLSLTFVAIKDDAGKVRLESSDHAGLFIHTAAFGLDKQTTEMLRGMPQSLVLTDSNGQHTILCAAVPVLRPVIPADPFSTELVLDRHRVNSDKIRQWVDGRSWVRLHIPRPCA